MTPEEFKAKLEKVRTQRATYAKRWAKAQRQRREIQAKQRKAKEQHQREVKIRNGRMAATILEDFSQAQLDKRVRVLGGCCVYCGGPFQHLDHLVPVACGGRHALWNLAPSCRACNTSKADSDPVDWVWRKAINKTSVLLVERAVRRHLRKSHA